MNFKWILAILALGLSCWGWYINKPMDYQWPIPKDFPKPQVPSDNPMTYEKVELGRHLFYDVNLSLNRSQSCASCHSQQHAFAEPLTVSIGSTGEAHRRNAPALVNIAYNKTLTWAHSGLQSIERQLLIPLFGEEPVELGLAGHEQEVLARFNTEHYRQMFDTAFGDPEASFDHIVKALASFTRSLISVNSRFDNYAYGFDDSALTESELNGMTLFFSEQLECHHCHGGFNFTQSTFHESQILDRKPFHNTGMYNENGLYPREDSGLAEITLNPKDDGKFRAPTLRNIEFTAPYMHDGSISSLSEVIDFYAQGGRGEGINNPNKSPFIRGFDISAQEKQDLINFLLSLSDPSFIENPQFSKPNSSQ